MGMSVLGVEPTGSAGTSFDCNAWFWNPLVTYCLAKHPDLTSGCEGWRVNGGDGLEAEEARALGLALRADLEAGIVDSCAADHGAKLESLPQVECASCHGRGRHDGHPCPRCEGNGRMADLATWYPFSAEVVAEFADFLVDCGGFEIW